MTAARVTLHGLSRSVYTRIARIALEEKGVGYSLIETEIFGPGGASAEHLRRQPFGRIPVLEHSTFTLYETQAITRYVDEAFPGPALLPPGTQARARMNQAVGILDAYAYRPMIWGVVVPRLAPPAPGTVPDEAAIAAALVAARTALGALEALAAGSAPEGLGLVSPELSLADAHAYPILRLFSLAPEGRAAIEAHPRLHAWMAGLRQRPSIVRTQSPREGAAEAAT